MKHQKIFKALFIIVSLLFFLSAVAIIPTVIFFPKEKVADYIEEYAMKNLGRKLEINNLSYGLRGVTVRNFVLHDGPDISSAPIIQSKSATLRFSLIPLLKRQIELKKLTFTNLNITVEYADGEYNIKRLIDSVRSRKKEGSFKTILPEIELNESVIIVKSIQPTLESAEGTYQVEGTISFDDDLVKIEDTLIELPKNRGTISGDIFITRTQPLKITGSAAVKNLYLDWIYRFRSINLPFVTASGTLSDIQYSAGIIKTTADLSSLLSTGKTLKAEGSAEVRIKPILITLNKMNASVGSSSAALRAMTIAKNESVAIAIDAPSAQVRVEDIFPLIPFIPSGISGLYKGSFAIKNGKITGKGEISDAAFMKDKNFITDIRTEVSVTNNVFSVEKVPLKINGSAGTVTLTSLDDSLKNFAVNLSVSSIDLTKIPIPKKNSGGSGNVNTAQSSVAVKGNISAKTVKIKDYTASDLSATFHYSADTLSIPLARISFLDASLAGNGKIEKQSGSHIGTFNLNFENLKVQRLGEIEPNLQNRVFGFAKGKTSFSINLSSSDIPGSINGSGDFSIDSGKIVNTGIQNSLGFLLDPLKFKLRDLEFKTIYGNFQVAGSRYQIRSLTFNSRDIRLSVTGEVERSLKGNLDIKLEFDNDFIADIPNITYTYLNKFKAGKWYTIPIKASGNDITDKKNIRILE